jgi:methyl-accepting chemotaxis protein
MTHAMLAATRRLVTVLRQTQGGDRRRDIRWPVEVAARLSGAGRSWRGATVDLSRGGALLRLEAPDPAPPGRVRVDLDGIGAFPARVVARSPLGLHLAFAEPAAADAERLAGRLATAEAEAQREITHAQTGARRVAEAFEAAIAAGRIGRAELFSTDYRPVPASDPQQYLTPALPFLEETLTPILETMLAADRNVTFCVAVDINGYLPVHNRAFSQPQRPGDPVWNAANARNRRIFDDRTGLLAARNTQPFLVQTYARDLGGGRTVMMREVDAPIWVDGAHWGGFRTACRL